jgi:DNA sulfur modification protein DndD
MIRTLLEQKHELESQVRALAGSNSLIEMTESTRELFDQLQVEMESYSTQIGRKIEQLRLLEDEILLLEKNVSEIEMEIEKLYEKHNISKEKAEFIAECDAIASVLNQFIVRLRKNKVHLLQEKTFEMYMLLSSRSGLIKDLTIDDKTYEIRISDRNGHEIKKSGLSAGEKEVFAISLLWGLAQTSQLKLPIIIDTPLSRLDSTHRDNIVNNYFPNAGEQVVILSTDTEIDKNYYRNLKPHLSGAGCLVFDQRQELTTFKSGYFWES